MSLSLLSLSSFALSLLMLLLRKRPVLGTFPGMLILLFLESSMELFLERSSKLL